MKKVGIIVFIVAILAGVLVANLFSFGRASGKLFNFSFVSGIKGSGVSASERRDVSSFKGVDVGGVFEVEVIAGKDFKVEVEADDNLLQYIETDVDGGTLKIRTAQRLKSHTPMRVRIWAPNIERIDASGVCKVSLTDVKNSELKIDISGASKVAVAGETNSLSASISGASSVDAENLKAVTGDIEASGASSATVFVTGRLVSQASGASKIAYLGNPTSVEKDASGASKVYPK